jgi:hypothetical protein
MKVPNAVVVQLVDNHIDVIFQQNVLIELNEQICRYLIVFEVVVQLLV